MNLTATKSMPFLFIPLLLLSVTACEDRSETSESVPELPSSRSVSGTLTASDAAPSVPSSAIKVDEPKQPSASSSPVILTPRAAYVVRETANQHDIPSDFYLRVIVQEDIASGVSYALDITEHVNAQIDFFCESHGVRLVIERDRLKDIEGTVIDYVTTDCGTGFQFLNPD